MMSSNHVLNTILLFKSERREVSRCDLSVSFESSADKRGDWRGAGRFRRLKGLVEANEVGERLGRCVVYCEKGIVLEELEMRAALVSQRELRLGRQMSRV